MKRLLITGAAGFVGRHCVQLAIEQGYDVWAVRSGNPRTIDFPGASKAHWRTVDLLNPTALANVMQEAKPTHVLHAAWVTDHGSYWTSPANLDWLALGTRLCGMFAEHGGKRFVSVGTCAEYDWNHGFMVEGLTPENPSTFYGKVKLAHHKILMASAHEFGFSAATGRIFFAYGPFENRSRLIPYICESLLSGKDAVLGSCRFYRDFMHVRDVAAGLLTLVGSEMSGAVNIASALPIQLIDIVRHLGRLSGNRQLLKVGAKEDKESEPVMVIGSNQRLSSLGWSAQIEIEEGLSNVYDWWSKSGIQEHDFRQRQ